MHQRVTPTLHSPQRVSHIPRPHTSPQHASTQPVISSIPRPHTADLQPMAATSPVRTLRPTKLDLDQLTADRMRLLICVVLCEDLVFFLFFCCG